MNKHRFKFLCSITEIDKSKIPTNTPYCYSVDKEAIKKSKKPLSTIPIKMCPYYTDGKSTFKGCLYTTLYTNHDRFLNKEKICNIL